MAKKQNKPQTASPAVPKKAPQPAAAAKSDRTTAMPAARMHLLIAAGIALITWFFYRVCLNNQLTNWDDPGYIRDNALIKDLSAENLKRIFSTAVMGNYHPLTILSYAIEYSYVRLEPWLYHLDSVLFHIIATVLTYFFVQKLTGRTIAAAVAALLFGLHPMHVESVAWLAGRKDVIYGSFYIAACLAYVYYLRADAAKRTKWYVIVVLLFLCSLLAKPVAVTLPVVLLLIDYFEKQKLDKGAIVSKLPLLLISIAFGIKSMMDQKQFGSLTTENLAFDTIERIALGGYAFITYLWKAVLPVGLSNFYPYPPKDGGHIASAYYLYPLAAAAILACLWIFRKNKVIIFGSLFFLANIALLLQILPVGGAILADRYSYIPYLGLFFMAGWGVSTFFEPGGNKQIGKLLAGGVGAYCLFLGVLTTERCNAWYDTASLWRDEIEKQPTAANAFNNLGFEYFNKFNESVNDQERKVYFDSANYLLNRAIQLDPKFANPMVSLGELHRAANKFNEARAYYYKGLALHDKEGSANAYLGLAIIYAIAHATDSSVICFRNAIGYKYHFPEAHSNLGNLFDMLGKPDSALKEYGIAIEQNPDMYAPYLNRGRLFGRMKRCDEGMRDFEAALSLRPDMGEIYYARSQCNLQKGNRQAAIADVQKAISLGYRQIDPAYQAMLEGR
ncbi:MAG: tetratricopeptide repeat protein [Taibaiella sp.]|nr:tetratricopeptide repeat protein [Taibaiella sp.]